MRKFPKRRFANVGEAFREIRTIFSMRKEIRALMSGEDISPSFRERLMLAVTSVNKCRYCSHAHSREALSKGISPEEVRRILGGEMQLGPEEEIQALLYAQHWAESNGKPESVPREKMVALYGEKKTGRIELALRMIRTGNLLGNTFDYVLYTITFGKIGG
jgi:AhpD family alkylhydroperoxidase